jgi:hypothetical protein
LLTGISIFQQARKPVLTSNKRFFLLRADLTRFIIDDAAHVICLLNGSFGPLANVSSHIRGRGQGEKCIKNAGIIGVI